MKIRKAGCRLPVGAGAARMRGFCLGGDWGRGIHVPKARQKVSALSQRAPADSILSMPNIIMNVLEKKKKRKNAGGRKLNRFRCYKANLSKGMTFPRVCLLSLSKLAW